MLLIVVIFYLVLGCFMEMLSMMITTIPIVAPIMIALGYDPIWLGILIIVLVEAALITPPVGLNLFVVQSLRKSGSMTAVITARCHSCWPCSSCWRCWPSSRPGAVAAARVRHRPGIGAAMAAARFTARYQMKIAFQVQADGATRTVETEIRNLVVAGGRTRPRRHRTPHRGTSRNWAYRARAACRCITASPRTS